MKIAVIGAGIVGITSAYELALDGNHVSVFEKNAAIAEEASFANAGLLAPSLLHPLSHTPWPNASWTRLGNSAIAVTRHTALRELRWLWGWKKNPGQAVFLARFAQLQQLLSYSLQHLQARSKEHGIAYEATHGQMALLTTEAAMQALQPKLAALAAAGVPFSTLTADQARAIEPGLDPGIALHAAVHFPQDEIANCRQVAHLLKEKAMALGVAFHFGAPVQSVQGGAAVELTLASNSQALAFDHIVVCAGSTEAPLGLGSGRLPLTHVHSHSVSVPVKETLQAPNSAIFNSSNGVSVVRMGARIRVSGGATLGAASGPVRQQSTRDLFNTLQTCFPGAGSFNNGTQIWRGSSAFSPDGLPLVGATATPGIWLNMGHGHNGWGMASGCARVIADLIGQNPCAFDTAHLQPARFHI